jgi:hypothetical protein
MKEILDRLFDHWKSTVIAIIILALTVMLFIGKITVEQFGIALGSVLTMYAAFKKDDDINVKK